MKEASGSWLIIFSVHDLPPFCRVVSDTAELMSNLQCGISSQDSPLTVWTVALYGNCWLAGQSARYSQRLAALSLEMSTRRGTLRTWYRVMAHSHSPFATPPTVHESLAAPFVILAGDPLVTSISTQAGLITAASLSSCRRHEGQLCHDIEDDH